MCRDAIRTGERELQFPVQHRRCGRRREHMAAFVRIKTISVVLCLVASVLVGQTSSRRKTPGVTRTPAKPATIARPAMSIGVVPFRSLLSETDADIGTALADTMANVLKTIDRVSVLDVDVLVQ